MQHEKRDLISWLGLLGIISLLSYTAAVLFAPLAYPDYNWMAQAVSDLSAAGAPSQALWNQLSALYNHCSTVCITLVCVFVQGKLTRMLRVGMDLYAGMHWVAIGYNFFPLSEAGMSGVTFQDGMHIVITVLVMLLSVAALVCLAIGGVRAKRYRSLAVWASAALFCMLFGGIGFSVMPAAYLGVFERFSVFAAAGFDAVLGVYLFLGFPGSKKGGVCEAEDKT